MKFEESPLQGAFVVDLSRREDERGFFARTFCAEEFAARGLISEMPQCSVSFNRIKGTLRGLHFQHAPHEETKLVRCTSGAIYDVIVDVQPLSPTYRRWFATELSESNRRAVYVPRGFAHGFITLVDAAEVLYMISPAYVEGFAGGLRWDDPALGIRWPMPPTTVSERDRLHPLLAALDG